MPRVTEKHRRARRDEIADAVVRVLQRKGVSGTSIAEIVEESGLSSGAIYANFSNKSELARYVAASQLDWRVEQLDADSHTVRSPIEVVRAILTVLGQDGPPLEVVIQYWSEATRDAEMHALLTEKVSELRDAFARAIRPWAIEHAMDDIDDSVMRLASTMSVLCQGYLANAALFEWVTPEGYLAAISDMFDNH